jgi:transcriptional regulator with PAS, ATPase and Fis domain
MNSVHTTDIENIPCGFFRCSPDGTVRSANQYLAELAGRDDRDLRGSHFSVIGLHDRAGRPWNPDTGRAACRRRFLLVLHRPDGSSSQVLVSLLTAAQQEVLGVVVDLEAGSDCGLEVSGRGEGGTFYGIVGSHPALLEVNRMVELAAESEANVLILGESGTGKELIADAIHRAGPRHNGPFVRINCAALSETLLESELFGHVRGAFTGALRDKQGVFETASGGTLFLDEIGDISPLIQVRLLRVIQERTVIRVGENQERPVDLRLVAATNHDLRQQVKAGGFREDLFFRLNVFPIRTVPLRERQSDIPQLCEYFIKRFNRRTGKQIAGLENGAMRLLMDYCWPGNVRELVNSIEHAFVLCQGAEITSEDLPREIRDSALRRGICADVSPPSSISSDIQHKPPRQRLAIGRAQLLEILEEHGWHRRRTAEVLGISTVALWKKMKKFNLREPT